MQDTNRHNSRPHGQQRGSVEPRRHAAAHSQSNPVSRPHQSRNQARHSIDLNKSRSNSAPLQNNVDTQAGGEDLLDEPFPSSAGQPIVMHEAQPLQPHSMNPATADNAHYAVPSQGFPHQNEPASNADHMPTMTGAPSPANAENTSVQTGAPQQNPAHTNAAAHATQPAQHAAHQQNQQIPSAAEREFNPTPILVPVPNPIGRSKIRKEKQRKKKKIIQIGAIAVVVIALVLIFFPWDRTITLNGKELTVAAHTTLHEAAEANDVDAKPGDLLAIDGSVIEAGAGNRYTFVVNGQPETDSSYELKQDDVIQINDGDDITEEFTEEIVNTSAPVVFDGVGAVHAFRDEGTSGTSLRKTGQISGISVDTVQTEPSTQTMVKYNVDSGDDKVIALTFDDGPWKTHTTEILDILRDNNAKATFFTVGERIADLKDVVKRASDEGHQICTHTWDHAAGSGQGVNLDYMTDDEQRQEVAKGMEAISDATGEEASKVVRVPGGNLSENTARILSEYATSEIGWNIDTNDWRRPGADVIFNTLLQASPGDIILMHDGGGDRSQTVQALRDALPILAEQGYRFITIDELIENYPLS